MRNLVSVLVLGLVLLLGAGVVIAGIVKVRQRAEREECRDHFREMGLELFQHNYDLGAFPLGTVPNESLPPDKRLSWYVGAWGYAGAGQCGRLIIDKTRGWDAEENRDPQAHYAGGPTESIGEWRCWICPANPNHAGPGMIGLTHYVGIAGVGSQAAAAPAYDPLVGVFGYDRQTSVKDIKDGTSTTLLLMETALDNGPWTAGGPPTVRGLDPSRQPYLGAGRQFGGTHPGVTGAAFADGSVHFLRNSISPNVLEALATIAGGEDVPAFADP